nr:nuclease-related domain-containing protein [Mycoplasmopsis cynos]
MFENIVNEKLKRLIKGTPFKFIDGGVYSYNNKQYEIDSALISSSLLVVLEYKAINGILSGNADQKELNISKQNKTSKKLYKIKNPIFQNEYHIENIKRSLRKDIMLASLIIVPDDATIKISNIPHHVNICTISELENLISQLSLMSKKLPDLVNVKDVVNLFETFKISTIAEKFRFRQKIKQR